jgi:hypothetical protein
LADVPGKLVNLWPAPRIDEGNVTSLRSAQKFLSTHAVVSTRSMSGVISSEPKLTAQLALTR